MSTRRRAYAIAAAVATAATTALLSPAAASAQGGVAVEVQGAVAARLTLTKPLRMWRDVTASSPSPLFGVVLAKAGEQSYLAQLWAETIGERVSVQAGTVADPMLSGETLYLRPGSYDLTLFSERRARVRIRFSRALPHLTFRRVDMPSASLFETGAAPLWRATAPVSLSRPGRGFVVLERDEWTGTGRSMVESCVWRTAPCAAADPAQLAYGGDDVRERTAVFVAASTGTAPAGISNVTVQSYVTGSVTARHAVVLAIP